MKKKKKVLKMLILPPNLMAFHPVYYGWSIHFFTNSTNTQYYTRGKLSSISEFQYQRSEPSRTVCETGATAEDYCSIHSIYCKDFLKVVWMSRLSVNAYHISQSNLVLACFVVYMSCLVLTRMLQDTFLIPTTFSGSL